MSTRSTHRLVSLGAALLYSLAAATPAAAQAPAKPQAKPAAKPAAKAARKPAPKKPVPPPPPPELPLPEAGEEQLAAAQLIFLGAYECEFSQSVEVALSKKAVGYIDVTYNKLVYTMKPVLSSTGARRLEDVKGATLMIQIANKSMLMDVNAGRRLVDDCVHAEQRAARLAPPSGDSLGIDPVKAAAAEAAAAKAAAAAVVANAAADEANAAAAKAAVAAQAATAATAAASAAAAAVLPASAPR